MKFCLLPVLLTAGLLSWCLTGAAQPDTTAYTLPGCVALALANNADVHQANWQAETKRVSLIGARGDLLPTLAGGVTHGTNQGRSIDPFTNNYLNQQLGFASYDLNGSVTLWHGRSRQHRVQQARLAYEAGQLDEQQTRENVALSVMLAYVAVLNSDEQLRQARQQSAVTARQVERLEVLDRRGVIAPALLHDLRGQFAADHLNALTQRTAAQTARLTLAQLLNISFDPAMPLTPLPETPLPTASPPDARQLTLTAT